MNLIHLASQINSAHAAALTAARSAIEYAREAGDLLLKAKASVSHGQWLPWLSTHCPGISERMAQRYMQVASKWELLEAKATRVSDLPLREAVRLLAEPKKDPEPDPPLPYVCRLISYTLNGRKVLASVDPHTDPRYAYVSVLTCWPNGDATMDGTIKPSRLDRLDKCLNRLMPERLQAADYLEREFSIPADQAWSYHRHLYDSHEEYMQKAVLGGKAH